MGADRTRLYMPKSHYVNCAEVFATVPHHYLPQLNGSFCHVSFETEYEDALFPLLGDKGNPFTVQGRYVRVQCSIDRPVDDS